jgi:hypothetical protein
MKIFYIFLNIYLPYYYFIISTCARTNGSISTSDSVVLISSPTNLVYDYISTAFVVEIASTFFLFLNYQWFFFFKVLWFL